MAWWSCSSVRATKSIATDWQSCAPHVRCCPRDAARVWRSRTATPAAKLDVQSTTQGFLPPRMTTAQRDAIAGPAAGLMLFNTTTSEMNFYDGSKWRSMVSGFSVRRANTALQSDITIHQVTPTWNYAVANLPPNTKALIVGVYYLHAGAANHGYLGFWAYQRGKAADSPDAAKFEAAHFDWYYNSDYSELIVP